MLLYFDDGTGQRYRSLGAPHAQIPSTARTVPEVVAELKVTRTAERSGRAQDKESEAARRDGYM
jgi:sulfate adenylyltransferase subunit 2